MEQERGIKENELNTEIAVENKKRQIRETQNGGGSGRPEEKANLLEKEALEAGIGRGRSGKKLVELAAENARAEADALGLWRCRHYEGVELPRMHVYSKRLASTSMKPEQLIAFAFRELAAKAEKIGQLNISPGFCCRELLAPQPARK